MLTTELYNVNETVGKGPQTSKLEKMVSITTADLQYRSKTHSHTEIKSDTSDLLVGITNCNTSETSFMT
jgi:hypothetical protein